MQPQVMWVSIVVLWLLATSVAMPIFFDLFRGNTFAFFLAAIGFVAWIEMAMLFSIYQATCAIFGTWTRGKEAACPQRTSRDPVAILYTTMNDFHEPAALSCIRQDYSNCHLFILDDSTEEEHRRLIDRFHARYHGKTTVVRRSTRNGFKAGNLNHALQCLHKSFPFFAVADADTILPKHFLDSILRRFDSNRVAFAQARLEIRDQPTSFVRDLKAAHDLYWSRMVPASARFGFMMFHGHAAVVRTAAWKDVGGFPEVVAEDLAFSVRARQMGYFGVFAFDVVCQEEHPQSYDAYKVQQLRYTRGAVEHTLIDMLRFILSPIVPWYEKLDRLVGNCCLFSCVPFCFSLVFAGLAQHLHPRSHLPPGWRLFAVTTITVLLPLVPAFMEVGRLPRQLARHVFASVYVHFSLTVIACTEVLRFVFIRRNRFIPTGDPIAVRKDARSDVSLWQVLLITAIVGTNLHAISITETIVVLCSLGGLLTAGKIEWEQPAAVILRYLSIFVLIFFLFADWPIGVLTASSVVLAANRSVSL